MWVLWEEERKVSWKNQGSSDKLPEINNVSQICVFEL